MLCVCVCVCTDAQASRRGLSRSMSERRHSQLASAGAPGWLHMGSEHTAHGEAVCSSQTRHTTLADECAGVMQCVLPLFDPYGFCVCVTTRGLTHGLTLS